MEDKVKMLIIDDSEDIVGSLYHFFSKKYEVFTALDGLVGLKLFEIEEGRFGIVITNLMMPYINGVGVISTIKKKYPGTPVIAITGWGNHPAELAKVAEADMVVGKPFNLQDLDRLATELLNNNKNRA